MSAELLRLLFPKAGPWYAAQYGRYVGTMLASPMLAYLEILKWYSLRWY